MVRINTCRLTRSSAIRSPASTSRSSKGASSLAGRPVVQGWGWLSAELATMVGRAMHRAGTAPDDRLRHGTGHEVAGDRRYGIRGETTNGLPGGAVG